MRASHRSQIQITQCSDDQNKPGVTNATPQDAFSRYLGQYLSILSLSSVVAWPIQRKLQKHWARNLFCHKVIDVSGSSNDVCQTSTFLRSTCSTRGWLQQE
ncbi:hypothetical protein PV05_06882 [Exophiala xenobiotica]|uniref:Uncharacterized protein n=1 Tax=Exophiala xenobiotica TaxID=348802 RepID=A0A0D2EGJ2_9EURO|nr:uncharacterized protein PV05_06882 [Exophiala xenobiotica]KIW54528.1 hypothetical protein PV05_06882 [Exophiala xenobiotica]